MRAAGAIVGFIVLGFFLPGFSGCAHTGESRTGPRKIYVESALAALSDNGPEIPDALRISGDFSLLSAVRFALGRNPSVRISRQSADVEKGTLMSATGEFGWEVSGSVKQWKEYEPMTDAEKSYYSARGYTGDDFHKYDMTSVSMGVSKKLRQGPVISQVATLERTENRVTDPDKASRGEIAFKVDIPLLKGRGSVSAAAAESSAGVLADAAELDVVHQSAQSVKEVTSLYWSYVSSWKNYELALESEQRAEKLLNDTRLTVEAEYRPKSVLNKLQANLEDKKARVIQKKYAVQNMKNSLALAMGLDISELGSVSAPVTPFPEVQSKEIQSLPGTGEKAVKQALDLRWDYIAQKKRKESSFIQLQAARRDLLPRLNLGLSVGYEAIHDQADRDEMIQGIYDQATDLEWEARLSFAVELGNDKAMGRMKRSQGSYRIETLKEESLANRIRSEVLLAIESLYSYDAEVSASREAVRLYEKAREDEYAKLRLGYSTFLDVIDTEDRLSQAQERLITAKAQLAQAVVNLRFAIGCLFVAKGSDLMATAESLETLPR
jgi:outer membrane protein TolC